MYKKYFSTNRSKIYFFDKESALLIFRKKIDYNITDSQYAGSVLAVHQTWEGMATHRSHPFI